MGNVNTEELKEALKESKKHLDGLVHAELCAIREWMKATMDLANIIGRERWPKVAQFCKSFVHVTELLAHVPSNVALRVIEELHGGE